MTGAIRSWAQKGEKQLKTVKNMVNNTYKWIQKSNLERFALFQERISILSFAHKKQVIRLKNQRANSKPSKIRERKLNYVWIIYHYAVTKLYKIKTELLSTP